LFGNVSGFGSGRNNYMDENLGFPMHPDVNMARSIFADPATQRKIAFGEAHSATQLIPNQFKASDYAQNGLIDMSQWLIDMSDADTVKLRRRWVDKDIPILGNAFAFVQRMGIKMAESIGNKQFAEGLFPSIAIRMAGIDAPEVEHGKYSVAHPMANQATEISERLMDSAQYLRVDSPQESYGRYVGTFTGPNDRDINRHIVLWGGAMSTGPQYRAAQQSAQISGAGIWESPFYTGIAKAQAAGVNIAFHQASSYKQMSVGNEGASLYSIGAWSMMRNNQMSGISDQRARNQHVFPSSTTESSLPYNMGSLYS